MESKGTIQQFKDKLADSEFQNTLNVSIEYTQASSSFGPYTDSTSPNRETVMNDLSNNIPADLTQVLVKGIFEGSDFYAQYGVNEPGDVVEVDGESGPVQTKPIIFF